MRWRGPSSVAALAVLLVVPTAAAKSQHANLELIPLQRAQIGAVAAHLALKPHSGALSQNGLRPMNVEDNGWLPATPVGLGYASSYVLDYGDPSRGGPGLRAVRTRVDEFNSAGSAKSGLKFWRREEGDIVKYSLPAYAVTITSITVPKLGAHQFAHFIRISVPGLRPISVVDEQVADGRYILRVQLAAGTPAAAKRLAPVLAKKLDQRLHLAIVGKLRGKPAKLPPPVTPGPPADGPDLSTLALTTADFSGTATIVSDSGYFVPSDPQGLSAYYLHLEPAGGYDELAQTIEWLPSASDAAYLIGFRMSGAVGDSLLYNRLHHFDITRVDLGAVGDDAHGLILKDTDIINGSVEWNGIVVMTRGRAADIFDAVRRTPIQASDLAALAASAANRLNSGLGG